MIHLIGIDFNGTSFMKGDSQLSVGAGDEGMGDSTEEETVRYKQIIRELEEFEEACESQ
jgi:hypothetical protein